MINGELEPPRELLAPCLLLLLAESRGHGYQLMERLKPFGFDWNGPGPIYRELHALEAANLVSSTWPPTKSGPIPRIYEITSTGREALARCAGGIAEWRELTFVYLARLAALATPSLRSLP